MPNVDARWTPLSVDEVMAVMRGAPFLWCLAGGRAIERLAGPYRIHDDTDIVVLRRDQLAVQDWFDDWTLALADPPGTLRPWARGERIPWRAHDVWTHRPGSSGWELQLMLQETEYDTWYYRRDDRVNGRLADLVITVGDVPCLRLDLQLLFKAKGTRAKDEIDFLRALPLLTEPQRATLVDWLRLTCANGHPWIRALEAG